jgi:uncharacterized repeat protein (TIGR01451 family)
MVNVGVSAASPQINSVIVSIDGSPTGAASDSTNINPSATGAPTGTLNYVQFHGPSDPDQIEVCSNGAGPCSGEVLAPGTNWTVHYDADSNSAFGVLRATASLFLTGDDTLGGLQGVGSFPSLVSATARSSFKDGFTISGGAGTGTALLTFTVNGTTSATAGQSGLAQFAFVPVVAGQPDYSHQIVYPVVNGAAAISIPFTFGVPVEFEVDFDAIAQITSWVAGALVDVDYSHSASLSAIAVTNSQGATVPSFTIQAESGTSYTANGVSIPKPLLSIAGAHTGNFAQGQQNATYTLTVSNEHAAAPTTGTVTVTETVPSGLTLVSMTGSDWNCAGNSCSFPTTVNPGASAPPISVNVNVAATAPAQIFNFATVSGGGSVMASASDPTTIIPLPSLSIAAGHAGDFVPGQVGAVYIVTVSNNASAGPTSGTVTVTEDLPAGLTSLVMSGNGWNCPRGGNTCTRSDALAAGASYPFLTAQVNVAADAPLLVTNVAIVSGGGSAMASASNPTAIITPVACDMNLDGRATVSDVQTMVNQVLGVAPAQNDVNLDGVVNVVDVQIVINATLGLGCAAS